jgi:hypothetical protein
MYRDEYQEFCKENGLVIAGCSYSSFYSSFGEEISGRELNRHKFENTIFEGKVLAKYTFDDEATYIRQSVGRSSGILSGYGEQHLWIWDGAELKLFARTVLEWVS